MKFDLSGKIAVVSGGSSGIGKAIAETLKKQGAEVFIIDLNENPSNKKLGIHTIIADITQANKLNIALSSIPSNIDILINNAGITGPTAPLWEYDVDMWKKVVDINLMGTFNCCKTVVPNMIKNNYGRIVNVASVAGKDGNANASAYSVGKAGAIGLTKSLGKELANKNIAVNAITPAGAKTRILDQMSKEHVQKMLSKVPRGRFLEVHEFTSLVCWLSSEENTFSTAAVFDISGGRSTY